MRHRTSKIPQTPHTPIHKPHTTMTDLFFPNTAPSQQELRLLMLIRYIPSTKAKGQYFEVNVRNWELQVMSDPGVVSVPIHYHEHLRRFIWRQMVFMELLTRGSDLDLAHALRPMLQRYVLYMDGIVEGLLTTAKVKKPDPGFRSRLFDLYLVVEYYVGRHEYDIVGDWRGSNLDIVLECQDVETLGKY